MSDGPTFYHDPDGAKWRAREKRIAELMREAPAGHVSADRHYCELVYDNEQAPLTTDREQLVAAGVELPPPDELDDTQLAAALRTLIDELARMRVYLSFTDHLTDRQLYTRLVEVTLDEPRRDSPMSPDAAMHVDMSEGDGELVDVDDGLDGYLEPEPVVDRDRHLPGRM